ncbi:hypothetical protein NDU88_003984 [Pleurodeles waltl]|uniref:Uncharacterized protein n=1 Tax=Pleurodeles waltl TaxID=8319 RepID=A0AAV7KZ03_PLEWA|nr:hypothetical protein NDU88_003984 [Pleurodeles waltl]
MFDTLTEDQKALWRRVTTVEEQQIDLQMKQEDLENRNWRNICIRGVPGGMESTDIMTFTADLLHAISGDADASPLALDGAYQVALAQRCCDSTPDILTRVHFTEKKAILQAFRKNAD